MKSIQYLLLAILFFTLQNCKKDEKAEPISNGKTIQTEAKNLNISILLDLSDRISPEKYPNPGMEIYKRDLGYIESISNAFEKHLKGSRIRQMDDRMQIFFEPEPMNSAIDSLANKMKVAITKDNVSKESIAQIKPLYVQSSSKIYDLALQHKKFVGSDIWSFFKNKVKDYCIAPEHRNILIILTDGYMFHKDNQLKEGSMSTFLTPELIKSSGLNNSNYKEKIKSDGFGFIPASDNLQNLEVIVLGINPEKGRAYEEDIIKEYWGNWFKSMNVEKYQIKGADLPSNLDTIINKIIN